MNPTPLALLLLVPCLSGTLGPRSQDAAGDQDKPTGFLLEAGEHRLSDVIDRAAKFLNRNYLVPAQEIANQSIEPIVLQRPLILDAIGCEDVVSQLAHSRDFVLTPVDVERGIYEFVFTKSARNPVIFARAPHWTPDQVKRRSNLRMVVTTTVPLQNLSAPNAGQQLRPFYAGNSHGTQSLNFGTVGGDEVLVITGLANRVADALDVVEQADARAGASQNRLRVQISQLAARVAALEKKVASKDGK